MRANRSMSVTAFLIALEVLAANLSTNAQARDVQRLNHAVKSSPRSVRQPPIARRSEMIDHVYLDAKRILSQANSCSQFFGGPNAVNQALDRLIEQLEPGLLRDSKMGILMSGDVRYFGATETQAVYRLFSSVTINTGGPFFKAKVFPAEPDVPRIGSFLPNTREARVLMLLHELAHLVRGPHGSWLIPDDGGVPSLSERNTAVIESQCRREILAPSGVGRAL
jgi:hypothetical protein